MRITTIFVRFLRAVLFLFLFDIFTRHSKLYEHGIINATTYFDFFHCQFEIFFTEIVCSLFRLRVILFRRSSRISYFFVRRISHWKKKIITKIKLDIIFLPKGPVNFSIIIDDDLFGSNIVRGKRKMAHQNRRRFCPRGVWNLRYVCLRNDVCLTFITGEFLFVFGFWAERRGVTTTMCFFFLFLFRKIVPSVGHPYKPHTHTSWFRLVLRTSIFGVFSCSNWLCDFLVFV